MPIISKDDAQGKADNRLDRNLKKPKRPKKELPLLERDFRDLITLKDQLEWIELKKKQRDKNGYF
jgi:hypothetical protein